MNGYLAIPGFADWKEEKIKEQLMLNMIPGYEVSEFDEFPMPPEIVEQHKIITGYYNIVSALLSLRQTERYFRRYPFSKGEVSREDHLKTCCELLFSRLYHFRERYLKHLTQLNRKTEPRKSLDVNAIEKSFDAHFRSSLDQRHSINHHTGYSDIELGAIGLSDMLSHASEDLAFMRASRARYRTVTASWVEKTRRLADDLDLYVGYTAVQMMMRCSFLIGSEAHESDRASLGSKEISA